MSGYAPLQQALIDVIKAEVQTAVAEQYQAEVVDLQNALAVAQRALNHTRDSLDNLCATFTSAGDNLAATRADLDQLRDAFEKAVNNNPTLSRADSSSCDDTPTTSEFGFTTLQSKLDDLRDPANTAGYALTMAGADSGSHRGDAPTTSQIDVTTVRANLENANPHLARLPMEPGVTPFSIPINTGVFDDASPDPGEDALKHYTTGLQLRFPGSLSHARRLCGTSDPWVIQELLNEGLVGHETSRFDSFERFVLYGQYWHPIFKVVEGIDYWEGVHVSAAHRLRSMIRNHAPGASISSPNRLLCYQNGEDVPVHFRICCSRALEFDWDKGCSLARDCHRILKDAAGVEIPCLLLEEDDGCTRYCYYDLLFLLWS